MAATIRWTLCFEGQGQGWAESYYFQQSNNDLTLAVATVSDLTTKRAALLADTYVLTTSRLSVIENPTGVKIKRQSRLLEPRINGVASWKPAEPNVAVLCRWETGNSLYNKAMYMRGVPAGIVDEGKRVNITFGGWLSRFNAWRSAMIAANMGWMQLQESGSALITGYTTDADTGIVSFTLGGAGLTWPVPFGVQTPVYISLPGKNPMDGRMMVIPSTATACITAKPFGVQPFIGIGRMVQKTVAFISAGSVPGPTAGQIHPQRMVTHKTGRPTYASRGRRSAPSHW